MHEDAHVIIPCMQACRASQSKDVARYTAREYKVTYGCMVGRPWAVQVCDIDVLRCVLLDDAYLRSINAQRRSSSKTGRCNQTSQI